MTKAKKNAKAKPAAKKAPAKKPVAKVQAKKPAASKKEAKPAKKPDVKSDKNKKPVVAIKAKKVDAKTAKVQPAPKTAPVANTKKPAALTNKENKKSQPVAMVAKGSKESAKEAKSGKEAKSSKGAVVIQEQVSVTIDIEIDAPKAKAEPKENIGVMLDHADIKRVFAAIDPEDLLNLDTDECQEKNCDNPSTTGIYCRFHYIKNWNEVKRQISIIKDKKLQEFIEDIFTKYGSKQLDQLCHDLCDEKSFIAILKELNIEADEEAFDEPDEDVIDDDTDIAFETKNTKVSYMED